MSSSTVPPVGWSNTDWLAAIDLIKQRFPKLEVEERTPSDHSKNYFVIWSDPLSDMQNRKLIGFGATETCAWLKTYHTVFGKRS